LPAFAGLVHGGGDERWPAEAWDGERAERVALRRDDLLPATYLAPLTLVLERFARGERSLAL